MTSTELRRQCWRRKARGGDPNAGAGLLVGCAVFAVCFLVCPQKLLSQESGGLLARQSEHHYRLGLRHVQSGDFQSAEREYRKAIEMDSTDVRPRDGLGFIYALQNRFREAEAEFERVLEIDPDYAPSLYKLGKIFLIRQDREKAKDAYERAIRIRADVLPRSSRTRHNLLAGGKTGGGSRALQDGTPAQVRLRPRSLSTWSHSIFSNKNTPKR